MNLSEYVSYDATGLAELIANKQVRPDELLRCAGEAIESVNGEINAVAHQFEAPLPGDKHGALLAYRFWSNTSCCTLPVFR